MRRKTGGASLSLPSANDDEYFIRDIQASAQKVLRKANKLQLSTIVAEAKKPPRVLVNGRGHGNGKSASCSPPRHGGASSSTSSPNVDSVAHRGDSCKYGDYSSSSATNPPRRVKSSLKDCDVNIAVRQNASHQNLSTANTFITAAPMQMTTQNATTPGTHHSKVTQQQHSSNIEYSKTRAIRKLSYSSSSVIMTHSTPANKKTGKRLHSPKRNLNGRRESERRQECHSTTIWSIDYLKMKYRSEKILRQDGNSACPVAKASVEEEMVPALTVAATTANAAHPLHRALRQQLNVEISRSLLHAAAKSRKQRFALDVHQVWVSNLSHLKEFKESLTNQKHAALYSECQASLVRKVVLPSVLNRRDKEAILAENSQIQSVNLQRAFDKAIKGYPGLQKIGINAWFSKRRAQHVLPLQLSQQEEESEGRRANRCTNDDEVDLSGPLSLCLQRAHFYRFNNPSQCNNVDLSSSNESFHRRNDDVYLIEIDHRHSHRKVECGRKEIGPVWVIRWYRLFEEGCSTVNGSGGSHDSSCGGLYLSEHIAKKCVFNAIQAGNAVGGHKELCSGVFRIRQLDALGKVSNYLHCYVCFRLRPATSDNGLRNILSIVVYPLTGKLRSIGPQKTIISVGDFLGNMGLASPTQVLFHDVCNEEYREYLQNLLICNGAQALAFGPMEVGEENIEMRLLVMSQGQQCASCDDDDGGSGLLHPLCTISPPDLNELQLLHARTVACSMLCLLQLKADREEGIALQMVGTEQVNDNGGLKEQSFHRLNHSEISHWEEERSRMGRPPIYQSEEEVQTQRLRRKVEDGHVINDIMGTEVIFSGIKHANSTAAGNKKIVVHPSSHHHHPIFASFFCDATRSSTNSTMVHLTAATPDVPMMMDSVTVKENKILVPTPLPHDPCPDNRPPLAMNPMPRQELLQLSSQSDVEKIYNLVEGFAPSVMVLNCLSQIEDYIFQGLLEERDAFKAGVHHRRGAKGTALGPFIRAVQNGTTPPSLAACMPLPLAQCDKLETLSYGITRQAAVGNANATRAKGRCICHSNQRCVEQFSRKRTPKDYAYISQTRLKVGIGDASCHYVTLNHQQVRGIFCISRKRYELDQKEARERSRFRCTGHCRKSQIRTKPTENRSQREDISRKMQTGSSRRRSIGGGCDEEVAEAISRI